MKKVKLTRVDVWVESNSDELFLFDIKTAKPNADEFWDLLVGKVTHNNFLDIFERVGIELRPEIDKYFSRFSIKTYPLPNIKTAKRLSFNYLLFEKKLKQSCRTKQILLLEGIMCMLNSQITVPR